MENGLSFMPNYLQMASFFVHGETYEKQKSMIFLVVCKRSRLRLNFRISTFRVHIRPLAKFEFPSLTPNQSRLKLVIKICAINTCL